MSERRCGAVRWVLVGACGWSVRGLRTATGTWTGTGANSGPGKKVGEVAVAGLAPFVGSRFEVESNVDACLVE